MAHATIRSISAETGLSLATVSRALKDSPAVKPDTARIVQEAAAKLGYQRNAVAANLRGGRTGLLSLVMPIERPGDLLGDVGALQLLAGASARVAAGDHTLTLVPYGFNDPPGDAVEALMRRGVSDGLILTLTEPDDARVARLQAAGMPFVTFGRTLSSVPHPFFDFDDEDFALRATRWLVARGCRRPALVVQPGPALFNRHRRQGFHRALAEAGLPGANGRILAQNDVPAISLLLRGAAAPDGIICDNEISALAIMMALRDEGREIGRDIHVTTLETSALPGLLSPPIPGFFQDLHRAGWVCADFLLRRLAGEDPRDLQAIDTMTFRDRTARWHDDDA